MDGNTDALQATARQASQSFRMRFFYVYILQSENSVKHFYVGFTKDLQDRLPAFHGAGLAS